MCDGKELLAATSSPYRKNGHCARILLGTRRSALINCFLMTWTSATSFFSQQAANLSLAAGESAPTETADQPPIQPADLASQAVQAASEKMVTFDQQAGSLLRSISQSIHDSSIRVIDAALQSVGVDPTATVGNEFSRSLLAVAILVPLTGLLVWLCSSFLRRQIRKQEGKNHKGFRLILGSAIRPIAMLIWVYGLFIAFSPLLTELTENQPSNLAFVVMKLVVLAFSLAALIWFLLDLTKHLRSWAVDWANTTEGELDNVLIPIISRSLSVILPMLAIALFISVGLPQELSQFLGIIASILIILAISWVAIQIILGLDDIILIKYKLDEADNLRARTIFTQVHVIQRIALVIVGLLTLASILLLFPHVQKFGQTILASAGVAGIVIGFAMQKALSNLLAGIQIAFTQPIRLDDVVIVENEWGWIEEITLTYVVVKIWDWRRLVLPISYFIEKPFQNWTRTSASIIGTIFMYVDYTIPVEELREVFQDIVKKNKRWDGQVYSLQVTECKENTVELRVLVSAVNSPEAWDLRCEVREAMLEYVQKNYPNSLPQARLKPLESFSKSEG